MAAIKKSESTKRVADIIEAEATEESKYMSFTATVGGEEIVLTTVRDVNDLPRRAMRYAGKRDLDSVNTFIEILLGPEQLDKIDALGATIGEFSEIAALWGEESGVEGK